MGGDVKSLERREGEGECEREVKKIVGLARGKEMKGEEM